MNQPSETPVLAREDILSRVRALRDVRHSDFGNEEATRRKLNAHGIDDEEIARQLSLLSSNTSGSTAVLTSYSLLHSLQHMDSMLDNTPRRRPPAEAVVTIFRCADIALGCMAVLSSRMADNLERDAADRFVANARWRAALHEFLYRLSSQVVDVAAAPDDGAWLDLRTSPAWKRYEVQSRALQQGLANRWPEPAEAIFRNGLDCPRRFVFFNEFVNLSDERIWLSRLSRVRLPGVEQGDGETPEAFYQRVVCSQDIEDMLNALETVNETDLLPFRVVHQISELIAGTVHQYLSDVIEQLLDPADPSLADAARLVDLGNRLLSGVDDSIKMMMRALTPAAYQAVRPNLGMVLGASSIMLRKTLFNKTYPLLVRALGLRLCEGSPELANQDDELEARARAVLREDGGEARALAAILRGLVTLHQSVRTWRDNHLQLPKTHLGISPLRELPTVSLSGSQSAVAIAHQMRKAHATDPIAPFYRAALGTEPPQVHEMLVTGGFEEFMARQTASAVFEVYDEVQQRFLKRRQRNASQPVGEPE
jgi:hypothetical protein